MRTNFLIQVLLALKKKYEKIHQLYQMKVNLIGFDEGVTDKLEDIKTFRGNIGEIYISIKGVFDGSDVLNIETTEDIINDWRKKGMERLREYERKPSPQRSFRGDWVSIL